MCRCHGVAGRTRITRSGRPLIGTLGGVIHRPPTVGPGVDLATRARQLGRVRDAVLSGGRPPELPRPIVARSWQRLRDAGITPERCVHPSEVAGFTEVELRRLRSPLRSILPELRETIACIADAADFVLVIADADGVVLWREGARGTRRHADDLGFIEGADWSEDSVGTNAIGTALIEDASVHLFSAEHYAGRHQGWYCIGEPVHDPRTGEVLGVVDISGPALSEHPSTIALARTAVRIAESSLWREHRESLDHLREASAPTLAARGPALVVDANGWVAAAHGLAAPDRVAAPETGTPLLVPGLGLAIPEPMGDGWILRRRDTEPRIELELDFGESPRATVLGHVTWTRGLSPRHAQILRALVDAPPEGLDATDLSIALFGEPDHIVAVRSEISRLRKKLGSILTTQPYRFADEVHVRVVSA